jgi:hypothetical protein
MTRIRSRLTYANVMSTLAVVIAVGGGTTAIAVSSKVGAKELKPIVERQASTPDPEGDPEPELARARCRKGEELTGGSGGPTEGAPNGNSWQGSGSFGAYATALCLTK